MNTASTCASRWAGGFSGWNITESRCSRRIPSTLCLSSYRATGAGDFPYYADCPRVRELQTEISELILNYFTAHPYVQVEEKPAYTVIRP